MVLLPQSDVDALLNAVPSFQERRGRVARHAGPRVHKCWQQAYAYNHREYLYDRAEMAEAAEQSPRKPES
jgi:hypothetical protein